MGLGQINTNCSPALVAKLKDPHENIRQTVSFLSRLQRTCKNKCSELGWMRPYNPGASPAYFNKIASIADKCRSKYDVVAVQ